jgi:hypothetical protein
MSASRVRRENTNAALADRRRRTREKWVGSVDHLPHTPLKLVRNH